MTSSLIGRREIVIAPSLPVVGPRTHGVALYAGQLAGMVAELRRDYPDRVPGTSTTGRPVTAVQDSVAWHALRSETTPVHLHFTDKLFGNTATEAADRVLQLAHTRPVTVTLHDLPQPSDGDRLPVRAAAYRRIAESVVGVVCNSQHEAALLAEFTAAKSAAPQVIPLPIIQSRSAAPRRGQMINVIAVLGYFYPGKGHAEIVDAVAAVAQLNPELAAGLSVLAMGAPSVGHESDALELVNAAAGKAVSFSVSGFLPELTLSEYCRRVSVPVAAHQHVSASGSVNSWIAHGRRPLVPATRYFREMDRLRPGTLTLFRPGQLPGALVHGLQYPESTWIPPNSHLGPNLKDVANKYLSWWRSVAT